MKSKCWLFAVAAVAVFLHGCQYFVVVEERFSRYYSTVLKLSTSADILSIIQDEDEEEELLSQSESVVASWVQSRGGSVLSLTMVAFDEEELTAVRKYGFFVNEKVKGYSVVPAKKLRFDAEAVLSVEILEEPYANENEKRIEILKFVLENFRTDMLQISMDSKVLRSSSMMVKQVMNTILVQLDQSPALAARLSRLKGMSFDHMTLGPGRIRMVLDEDIVKVKIKVGKDWFGLQSFDKHEDVINM